MNFQRLVQFFKHLLGIKDEWHPYWWKPDFAFSKERKIYDDLMQITNEHQLARGKVVIYYHWDSGNQKAIPQEMLVLSGPYQDKSMPDIWQFEGLFLNEDGTTWTFDPCLADASIVPSDGKYNNLSYMVDTGEIWPEWKIQEAINRNINI